MPTQGSHGTGRIQGGGSAGASSGLNPKGGKNACQISREIGGSRDEATGFRDTLVFTRTTLSAQPFAMSDHPPRGVQRAISGSQSG